MAGRPNAKGAKACDTRAGSISVYCAREALADSKVDFAALPKDRVGIYIGCTEHGNVETENEIYEIKGYDYDTSVWSHHHNPRTVANNPAGEITLNMGITGPHYTIGAACAAAAIIAILFIPNRPLRKTIDIEKPAVAEEGAVKAAVTDADADAPGRPTAG